MTQNGSIELPPEQTGAEKPNPETPNERPEWLPEKFNTPEDMAKAYGELEQKLGVQGSEKTPESNPPETTEPSGKDALTIEARKTEQAAEEANIDLDKYANEFVEKGVLSDESYEQLARKGLPRQVVDTYLKGQQALGQMIYDRVTQTVGGKDNLNNMLGWARENLPASRVESFNKIVNSGSEDEVLLAVRGLYSEYTETNGTGGRNLIRTGNNSKPGSDGVKPYASREEMIRAVSDPRYKEDPAYRNEVAARLAAANRK